eukprot:SAG31_NODE_151_length_22216_cov_37.572139_1_plen_176_part_00
MASEAGVAYGSAEAAESFAVEAYIDDAGMVGTLPVVHAGFATFLAAVEKRGWKVNFGKTVLAADFHHKWSGTERDEQRRMFADLFGRYNDGTPACHINWEDNGMVFLGTPFGTERDTTPGVPPPDAGRHAAMPLGNEAYRTSTGNSCVHILPNANNVIGTKEVGKHPSLLISLCP